MNSSVREAAIRLLHFAVESIVDSNHFAASLMHTQHGLLIDAGAVLACSAFAMAVFIGIYFLLDR
ncbi:hypothetical protein [Paraburkholderia sp. JHI869]|uniref:hypothetical protein n=1 Tax=Paraburkholderia sp. JHI869 TaxID=3112959 RepID=UPI0031700184